MKKSSTFLNVLAQQPFMLYDGPMETRIQFGTSIKLKNPTSIFALMFSAEGKAALQNLYEQDILSVKPYQAAIILNAPTYRASRAHIEQMGYFDADAVANINKECIRFVTDIRTEFADYAKKIFVTAPIGPEKTEYLPELNFTIEQAMHYHEPQANAIAATAVDLISIAAMPGAIEIIGCAKAVAKTGLPYSVGVILTPEGTLLDGHPFAALIEEIDNSVIPKPNFYIISCTHPAIAAQALRDEKPQYKRILGIKANGSSKPPEELLTLQKAEADEPDLFADELIALGEKHHFKIYGGCCGTDTRHLAALARKLSLNTTN